MFKSKKSKVVKQFKSKKAKLESCKDAREFYVLIQSTVDLAEKYVNQPAIIDGLKQLPNSNLTIAKTGYTKPEDEIMLRSKKEKADHYLNEIIDFLKHNELAKPEAKSFLETNKVLIPLLGSLLLVGLPTFFWWGYNFSKLNTEATRQREVDLLNVKIETLNNKVKELRDSIGLFARPKPD